MTLFIVTGASKGTPGDAKCVTEIYKNKEVGGIIKCCHQMSYLRLKCTKFDFGWGSAPDPAGGAHSAPPDP